MEWPLFLRSTEVHTKFWKDLRNFLFFKLETNPTLYPWTDWRQFSLQFPWLLLCLCLEDALVSSQPPSVSLLPTLRRRFGSSFLFLLRSSAGILAGRFEAFRLSPPSCGLSFWGEYLWLLRLRRPSQPPVFRVGLGALSGISLYSTNRVKPFPYP